MVNLVSQIAAPLELVLLSDHAREWIEYIENQHKFLGCFPNRFYSFNLGSTKQNPETFRRILKELKKDPRECILIDDNRQNIANAESVGLEGIVFIDEGALRKEFMRIGITI